MKNNRFKLMSILLILVLVLALATCGGGGDSGSEAGMTGGGTDSGETTESTESSEVKTEDFPVYPVINPSRLLSPEEATEMTGVEFTSYNPELDRDAAPYGIDLMYRGPVVDMLYCATLWVQLDQMSLKKEGGDPPSDFFMYLYENYPIERADTFAEVEGLGEIAFYSCSEGDSNIWSLYILHDGFVLKVGLSVDEKDAGWHKETLVKLAERTFENLKSVLENPEAEEAPGGDTVLEIAKTGATVTIPQAFEYVQSGMGVIEIQSSKKDYTLTLAGYTIEEDRVEGTRNGAVSNLDRGVSEGKVDRMTFAGKEAYVIGYPEILNAIWFVFNEEGTSGYNIELLLGSPETEFAFTAEDIMQDPDVMAMINSIEFPF